MKGEKEELEDILFAMEMLAKMNKCLNLWNRMAIFEIILKEKKPLSVNEIKKRFNGRMLEGTIRNNLKVLLHEKLIEKNGKRPCTYEVSIICKEVVRLGKDIAKFLDS